VSRNAGRETPGLGRVPTALLQVPRTLAACRRCHAAPAARWFERLSGSVGLSSFNVGHMSTSSTPLVVAE
jgi:hypothetical protein